MIKVKRTSDGKTFEASDFKEEIVSIEFEEYCTVVTVFEDGQRKKLVCKKAEIPLDELEDDEELGVIL